MIPQPVTYSRITQQQTIPETQAETQEFNEATLQNQKKTQEDQSENQ